MLSQPKESLEETGTSSISSQKKAEGIILPPDCDNPIFHHCGEKVSTFTPSSYRPPSTPAPPLPPHAMHGVSGSLSVPKCNTPSATDGMADYLNRFRGAYLCLDLWMEKKMVLKKCGTLVEVGRDFLVLQETHPTRLTLIDLKPVRYIQLYCR